MNIKDITKQILELHEIEEILELMSDVKKEFGDGIPDELSSELDLLLEKANQQEKLAGNVVEFKGKKTSLPFKQFAEVELLAAAGRTLGEWFTQPIIFGGAGFILDVRRVIGSENEVDVYLTPASADTARMKKTLDSYLGKTIRIVISNNDLQLLDAEIYIDENGSAAEGRGHLLKTEDLSNVKGKISVSLLLED